jgi:hypothetical protein
MKRLQVNGMFYFDVTGRKKRPVKTRRFLEIIPIKK